MGRPLVKGTTFVEFEWLVASSGYVWANAHPVVDMQISEREARFLTSGFTMAWRATYPLREAPSLFRILADLKATEKTIAAFATEHGPLTAGDHLMMSDKSRRRRGERLGLWQQEIFDMSEAVYVWDRLKEKSPEIERRFFLDESIAGVKTLRYRPHRRPHSGVTISPQFVEDPRPV